MDLLQDQKHIYNAIGNVAVTFFGIKHVRNLKKMFWTCPNTTWIIPKYVKCNNCEAVHKVYEINKSEIFAGKDQTESLNENKSN